MPWATKLNTNWQACLNIEHRFPFSCILVLQRFQIQFSPTYSLNQDEETYYFLKIKNRHLVSLGLANWRTKCIKTHNLTNPPSYNWSIHPRSWIKTQTQLNAKHTIMKSIWMQPKLNYSTGNSQEPPLSILFYIRDFYSGGSMWAIKKFIHGYRTHQARQKWRTLTIFPALFQIPTN